MIYYKIFLILKATFQVEKNDKKSLFLKKIPFQTNFIINIILKIFFFTLIYIDINFFELKLFSKLLLSKKLL